MGTGFAGVCRLVAPYLLVAQGAMSQGLAAPDQAADPDASAAMPAKLLALPIAKHGSPPAVTSSMDRSLPAVLADQARPLLAPAAKDSIATWTYQVDSTRDGELQIVATFARNPGPLSVHEPARPFVTEVAGLTARGFVPLPRRHGVWLLPSCPASGCQVRYRFLLGQAATQLDDDGVAQWQRPLLVTSPAAWLLRPRVTTIGQEVDVAVGAALRPHFAAGWFPASAPNTYRISADDLYHMPLAVIGPLRRYVLKVGGGTIDLVLAPGVSQLPESAIVHWVEAAAQAVAGYFGRYPVPHAMVYVPVGGGGGGVTYGDGGATIVVPLAKSASEQELATDWVMTHEMVHLALPTLRREHHWLEEGLATYVEPLARVRHGDLSAAKAFAEMVAGMPQGLPAAGDRGLDRTPTWGRTYWGGALFYLQADVSLRQQTHGRLGLADALRGILAAGGSKANSWPVEQMLQTADAATHLSVLADLYASAKDAPWGVDLPELWRQLGVSYDGHVAHFDDQAPLAYIRKAMVAPAAATE